MNRTRSDELALAFGVLMAPHALAPMLAGPWKVAEQQQAPAAAPAAVAQVALRVPVRERARRLFAALGELSRRLSMSSPWREESSS